MKKTQRIKLINKCEKIRKSKQWSLECLASHIGVSLYTYWKWSKGLCYPNNRIILDKIETFISKNTLNLKKEK